MQVHEKRFTPTETAAILGCKKQTLAVHRIKGTGCPFIKIGGRVLYSESAIEQYLNRCERTSTSDNGGGR